MLRKRHKNPGKMLQRAVKNLGKMLRKMWQENVQKNVTKIGCKKRQRSRPVAFFDDVINESHLNLFLFLQIIFF